MSFRDWFDHGGHWYKGDADLCVRCFVQDPAKRKQEDIPWLDQQAARAIEEARQLAEDLAVYRIALANRYSQLAAAPYTLRLELVRECRWHDKKRYFVRMVRRYADGTETVKLLETYPGTERHKAFSRFAALKKAHPGIDTIQDTEKRPWER